MSTLTTAQPLPPAMPLPDAYPRHDPGVDEQRSVLCGLLDSQPWPKLAWADLIEELLVLGRTDIPLVRLAEGHIDALRILDQADRTPEPNALYGVWASRSQQTGVQAQRTDSGGLALTGTLSFASGAGLLDRALVPVWLVDGTHLLVDLAAGDLPVDTTVWRTSAMAASRTHQVLLDGLRIDPEGQVGGQDFYLSRPGFLPGGVGVAACWVGGAARVVDLLHRRHPQPSPGQQLRLGRIRASLTGAAAMVRSSARHLDSLEPLSVDDDLVCLAAETRSVAADAVRRIIAEARLTTGPAGLALDQDISHAIPDLELYVSQHNVDADATVLGDPARRPG